MAKNKITVEWSEDGRSLIFSGSIKQPTLVEINNFVMEHQTELRGLADNYVVNATIGFGWLPPEEVRTVELNEFNGEYCPVCTKPYNMTKPVCPVCGKRWDE